jgi:hypothetical protein
MAWDNKPPLKVVTELVCEADAPSPTVVCSQDVVKLAEIDADGCDGDVKELLRQKPRATVVVATVCSRVPGLAGKILAWRACVA